MKKFILILLLFIAELMTVQGQDFVKRYLNIGIPQRSGLASADFKYYQIKDDSLYVLYRPMLGSFEDVRTLEVYRIDESHLEQLDSLLEKTDYLGEYVLGEITLGSPRFIITTKYQNKTISGFIVHCYREHIYTYIDWMNSVYPRGKVLDYHKEELIKREKLEMQLETVEKSPKRKLLRKKQ
jgi:gamma-glutamylcyclotransferase (GGCT)/AIG2-like uncharacterized protein YtfP